MNFLNRSVDKYHYLSNSNKSNTRNVFKLSGLLGGVMVLSALSIWAFTPVSDLDEYVPKSNATDFLTAYQKPVVPGPTLQPPIFDKIPTALLFVDHESKISFSEIRPKFLKDTKQLDSINKVTDQSSEVINKSVLDYQISTEKQPVVEINPIRFTIKSGDTLTKIFSEASLPISLAIQLARLPSAKRLNQLSVGKLLNIYKDKNDQLTSLDYALSQLETLVVTNDKGDLSAITHKKEVQYRQFTAKGVIQSSLSMAANEAGLSMGVANNIIDIYQWEIDFARDLHKGDTFFIVYQKAYVDDKYVDDGPILAASFQNKGRTIDAVRHTDKEGVVAYFQPNGESLKRGFLRTPIKVARISSKFGRRLHPIKKRWKSHNGVDYSAKRGTAIISTADGVVQYAGTKNGYGKTVILRHGGIYTTLYAHMSRFEKGIRTGKSVKQGQIIGRVGHTGWATGDHLHYEFRVYGKHKDPLKVKLPRTLPMAQEELVAFKAQAKPFLAQISSFKNIRVASN